jgi:signal transduction histidine kinase/CheY-like chemotaxis protein
LPLPLQFVRKRVMRFLERTLKKAAVFIALITVLSAASVAGGQGNPQVIRGVLDLTGTAGLDAGNKISLNGKWEFYWGRFLLKDGFAGASPDGYIRVPGSWNENAVEGKAFPAKGYATYRMVLKLDRAQEGTLAIVTGEIATAFELYVNGSPVGGKGRVSGAEETGVPAILPDIYLFDADTPEIEIVLHVSNYHYRKGGVWDEMALGEAKSLAGYHALNLSLEALTTGILLIIGLYHVIFSLLALRERSYMHFGFCCIAVGLRQAVIGHKMLAWIFPSLPFDVSLRMEYICLVLVGLFFALYLYVLFKKDFHKSVAIALMAIAGISMLFILVTPAFIFTYTIYLCEAVLGALAIYLIWLFIKLIRKGVFEALFISCFGVILILSVVNDFLYANSLLISTNLVSYGFIVFLFSQAILLARRYSGAFRQAENLSVELLSTNESLVTANRELVALKGHLEQAVEEKTHDLKIAMTRAESANKAKSAFLANISHELRTPLHAILGFSEIFLIERQDGDDNKAMESIRYIRESARYLLTLINGLLDISKIESGKLELNMGSVDLAALLNDVVNTLAPLADRKNVALEKFIPADHPLIMDGDEVRLKEIFINLLNNAIKFTGCGKRIGITAETMSDSVVITVWDEGPGIPQDEFSRIFEPFVQVSQGEKGRPKGSGLGLAIAKRLVEILNGGISVQSRLGEGSRFIVTFPWKRDAAPKPRMDCGQESADPVPDAGKRQGRVLMIEDNELNQRLFKRILDTAGIDADFALTGEDGIAKALVGGFSLILLDIELPDMSGYEVLSEIRRLFTGTVPPVIAVTAHVFEGSRDKFLNEGFSDYIPKPFEYGIFINTISRHMGKR